MKQQTAVEWLFEQVWITSGEDLPELLEQAKEMEEQQMFEFWNGGIDCTEGGVCFDQYYNETYKKE
jgi:hypothetical protein